RLACPDHLLLLTDLRIGRQVPGTHTMRATHPLHRGMVPELPAPRWGISGSAVQGREARSGRAGAGSRVPRARLRLARDVDGGPLLHPRPTASPFPRRTMCRPPDVDDETSISQSGRGT